MRVVVDVAPLSHPRTGVGNYIRGSLQGIAAAGGAEIVAFAPASASGRKMIEDSLRGIHVEERLPVLPAAHAVRTAWSRLGGIPVERVAGRLDVFHFSDWMYPPQRGGIRSTMIHDLVPLHFPDWVHRRTRRMHGAKYLHAAEACDVVMVNSEFTANDVAATLGVDRDRIHVAYPGVDPAFTPDGPRAAGDYVLAVGTLEPRKNLSHAIAAAQKLGVELRVVGARGWGGVEARGSGVTWLGPLPDDELAKLYRGARVFVYPSRFEGFGIPVVEAMACGTPVVASSHPSLDEASGEVAVRADPDDPDAIAAAIGRAGSGRDERGIEHARRFTWLANGRAHLAAWAR
ncbi:MAG: glycosyltransferase family 4 protein [Actinobacteria bacterium]|nr:glycosyltransferase family 4 protein [Actinomycetota bacterium]